MISYRFKRRAFLTAMGGGLGLKIMRYRASVIGAQLTILPREGGGTLVVCALTPGDGGAKGLR